MKQKLRQLFGGVNKIVKEIQNKEQVKPIVAFKENWQKFNKFYQEMLTHPTMFMKQTTFTNEKFMPALKETGNFI